jgi:hypothetical protein
LSLPSQQIFSIILEKDRFRWLKEVGYILYLVSNLLEPEVDGRVKVKVKVMGEKEHHVVTRFPRVS